MRFHVGFSFKWKTIKKFIIPIILGIIAYFLGGFKVNAYTLADSGSICYSYLQNDTEYSSCFNQTGTWGNYQVKFTDPFSSHQFYRISQYFGEGLNPDCSGDSTCYFFGTFLSNGTMNGQNIFEYYASDFMIEYGYNNSNTFGGDTCDILSFDIVGTYSVARVRCKGQDLNSPFRIDIFKGNSSYSYGLASNFNISGSLTDIDIVQSQQVCKTTTPTLVQTYDDLWINRYGDLGEHAGGKVYVYELLGNNAPYNFSFSILNQDSTYRFGFLNQVTNEPYTLTGFHFDTYVLNQIYNFTSEYKYVYIYPYDSSSPIENLNIAGVEECSNGNQAIYDSLTDDNISGGLVSGGSYFGEDIFKKTYGIADLINIPFNFIQSLTNTTCSPLTFTLPFINQSLTLPCISGILISNFGDLFNLYQLIIGGVICFYCAIGVYREIENSINPYGKGSVADMFT